MNYFNSVAVHLKITWAKGGSPIVNNEEVLCEHYVLIQGYNYLFYVEDDDKNVTVDMDTSNTWKSNSVRVHTSYMITTWTLTLLLDV